MKTRALLACAVLTVSAACSVVDTCRAMKRGDSVSNYELSAQTSRTIELKPPFVTTPNTFFLGPGTDIACCLADAGTASCGTVDCSSRLVTDGLGVTLAKEDAISDGQIGCGMWTLDGRIEAAWLINKF